MSTFSFIENPLLNVLKQANALLPGIEKVIAIYYCNEASEVKAKTLVHENTIEDIALDNNDDPIDKLRKATSNINWYSKDETPFEVSRKKKHIQMNVFHEFENVVLSLGFPNEHDKKNDLLFFFFNKDISNFGLTDSNKILTPDNKKIISFILYNSIKTMIEIFSKDLNALKMYNENTKSLVKRHAQSREELETSKNNYGLSLINLSKLYIKEFSEDNSRFNYILTEDALHRIKKYQGDITILKVIIKQAINYVNNLYFDSKETDIYISEDYLNFESIGAGTATKPQEVQLFDKYSKTIMLLDKLEKAARDVVAKSMDLTGTNVGGACSTPISAPAISDAVKKHKNKILHLINKYPDRWKLIRNEFRPVKNILTLKTAFIEKSA